MRHAILALCASAIPGTVLAQPLARRVADARPGAVRLAYAPRPGLCGDGRDAISFGDWFYVSPSMMGHGRTSMRCVDGPVRVALTRSGATVNGVRTSVGGRWGSSGTATDLGTVSAAEAGDYFFTLAGTLEGRPARDALLAAVVADSVDAAPRLLRLARDDRRPLEVRRGAVRWLGTLGGDSVVPTVDALARDVKNPRELRETALSALAEVESDAAVTRLIAFSEQTGESWLARKAVFWLGQTSDARAHEWLRSLMLREGADEELRADAIFALGHGSGTPEDAAMLREAYPKLGSGRLKEKVIQSVAQIEGEENMTWLLALALNDRESFEQRKQALFWAGQSDMPGGPIVKTYDRLTDRALKEHAIFVFSQRDDDVSLDKLIDIARNDPDRGMRRKAIFWLGQSEDPRAQKLIRDLVSQ